MGKKFGLNFDGVAELSEKLEALGGDLQKVAEEALEFIPGDVNPKLHAAMVKHNKTGLADRSIVTDQKVSWTGNVASIDVGFNLKKECPRSSSCTEHRGTRRAISTEDRSGREPRNTREQKPTPSFSTLYMARRRRRKSRPSSRRYLIKQSRN